MGLGAGLAFAAWIIGYGLFGPVVPIGDGFGWDGVYYGRLATDFFGAIQELGIPPDRAGRLLPSYVVYESFGLFSIERTAANIRLGFVFFNALCGFGTLWAFERALAARNLDAPTRAFGLGGLVISFAGLVMPGYYAPLTDSAGWLAATLALLAAVRRSTLLFALSGLLAAFVWPTAAYVALFLAWLSPADERPLLPRRFAHYLGGAAFLGVLLAGWFASYKGFTPRAMYATSTPPLVKALPLSIIAAAAYVGLGATLLLRECPRPRLDLRSGVVTTIVFVVTSLITRSFASAPGKSFLAEIFVGGDSIFGRATVAPGVFWVAHASYFGALFVVANVLFPRVAKSTASLGAGAVVGLLAGLVLSLTSESRHVLAFWPLLVFVTILAVERVDWLTLIGFLLLALGWSEVWRVPHVFTPEGKADVARYSAHHGPWMPRVAYLWRGVLLIPTLGLVIWRRRRRPS